VNTDDLLLIGKIVGIHGIHGFCKVKSYAESLSVFDAGRLLLLRNEKGEERTRAIESAKPHGRYILLSFKDVFDRNGAEHLTGSGIYIEKASLPKLEENVYYWFDLIGLAVYTPNGQFIGRLDSVMPTGSNDVYVVKNKESETLVPALESVVVSIDLNQKKMVVQLPEGL
jgi:16S rRNA processing protein RimM